MNRPIPVSGLCSATFAALILALAGASCGGPLYRPGEAGRMAALPLPPQNRSDAFRVEEDVYLYHFEEGSGRTILFLHGGPGIPPVTVPEGLHKLDGFRVVFPHERGSGRSSRPVDHFASANYYANMKELDRRLGISAHLADIERMRILMQQERLTIIGHSFGGFLAALYAAEFPDRVDRLILVAPAGVLHMPATDGGLYEQVRRKLPASELPAYDAFLKRFFDYGRIFEKNEANLSALNREFLPFFERAARTAGMPGLTPLSDSNARDRWVGGWVAHGLYFSLGRKTDLTGMMEQIHARTLIIHGAKDLSPPESSSDYLRIANHRLAIMPDSGHFPFSDHPQEFAKIVQEFLTEK